MKRLLALAAVAAAAATTGGSANARSTACPTTNPPNELVLRGGSGQTAQLGRAFPQSLQVELANSNGCSLTGDLAGTYITFDAPGGGASGIFAGSGTHIAVVGTDSQGIATAPPFTANFTTGDYTVDAQSDYGTVRLYLSNTSSGVPTAIAPSGTTSEDATVDGNYAQPLQARVTDASGNPVQGATVAFAVTPGSTGASAGFLGGGASATTDANGLATSPPLVANNLPGRFAATASTAGVATVATYALDNHAATTTLQTATHDPTAIVETHYRSPLRARVLDAAGQPIEGATVTFTVTAADNGATAAFLGGTGQATVLTDADGVAVSPPLVANKTAGAFTATASAAGASPTVFTLENLAAAPASVTVGAAAEQETTAGTRFPIPIAVTVLDRQGNPVPHATVTFAAPSKGASGRFRTRRHGRTRSTRVVRVRTNRHGIAVAPPFAADGSAGGYAVIAVVRGSAARAAVPLVNLPRG